MLVQGVDDRGIARTLFRAIRSTSALLRDLTDVPLQLLKEGKAAGVEALSGAQTHGKIRRVNALVRHHKAVRVLFAQLDALSESHPLVLDPNRIEVFGLLSEHDHNLCGLDGVVYVGLVPLGYLIAQAHTAEEYLVPLGGQDIVKLVGVVAVLGSLDPVLAVAVLLGNEHVVCRLAAGLFHPLYADALDLLRLLLIGFGNVHGRQFNSLPGIAIVQEGAFADGIAGGHFFVFV